MNPRNRRHGQWHWEPSDEQLDRYQELLDIQARARRAEPHIRPWVPVRYEAPGYTLYKTTDQALEPEQGLAAR